MHGSSPRSVPSSRNDGTRLGSDEWKQHPGRTHGAGALRAAGVRAVELDYPAWHVCVSDAGRWWATRAGGGDYPGNGTPVPMTVDADDEAGLREALEPY